MRKHKPIPKDFQVQPLDFPGDKAEDPATCGYCGLSWDDGKITGITPAPAGRCPFEHFHIYDKPEPAPSVEQTQAHYIEQMLRLRQALQALVEDVDDISGYWTEGLDNTMQAAREVLQQTEPKEAGK